MPVTLSIQTAATFTNAFGGQSSIGPLTVQGTITPLDSSVTLASGNNSFTVPAGAVGVIIEPPSANTVVLKVKTTIGDTGIVIPPASASLVVFDPNNLPATLYINAASLTSGYTTVKFF